MFLRCFELFFGHTPHLSKCSLTMCEFFSNPLLNLFEIILAFVWDVLIVRLPHWFHFLLDASLRFLCISRLF